MIMHTLGSRGNPAVVMIHGMFCNADMVKSFARYLADDYYIIIPTLTGHYKQSESYAGASAEAQKIMQWLNENGIERLAMIQGTSMGAEIALELARQCTLPVEHYLFDGGPFFDFSKGMKTFMRRKFQWFADVCANKVPEEAAGEIMKNGFVRALIGKDADAYKEIIYIFCCAAKNASKETVRNVTETCYACSLPEFDKAMQSRFVFLFSQNEPARKSEKRLRKAYPQAEYIITGKLGHCGFQVKKPREYAEFIARILRGDGAVLDTAEKIR